MAHHPGDVVGDGGVGVPLRHELAVTLESDIGRFASRPRAELPGQPEPGGSWRLRPFAEDLLKGREGAPDMVEDPIEQHSETAGVCGAEQSVEIAFVAQSRIDAEMVDG